MKRARIWIICIALPLVLGCQGYYRPQQQLAATDYGLRTSRAERDFALETARRLELQNAKALFVTRTTPNEQYDLTAHLVRADARIPVRLVHAGYVEGSGLSIRFNWPLKIKPEYENRVLDLLYLTRKGHLVRLTKEFELTVDGELLQASDGFVLPVKKRLPGRNLSAYVIYPNWDAFEFDGARSRYGAALFEIPDSPNIRRSPSAPQSLSEESQ